MACNCNKKKAGRRVYTAPAPRTTPNDSSKPGPVPPADVRQSFALELQDGTKRRFGSKLEAEAARVRAGYRGRVRPA